MTPSTILYSILQQLLSSKDPNGFVARFAFSEVSFIQQHPQSRTRFDVTSVFGVAISFACACVHPKI
jgi:hypothetical protein